MLQVFLLSDAEARAGIEIARGNSGQLVDKLENKRGNRPRAQADHRAWLESGGEYRTVGDTPEKRARLADIARNHPELGSVKSP